MSHSFPTVVLRQAREDAAIKQGDLADKLGVSASVVSRLEKAGTTDPTMAKRYLEAIGTPVSREILEFYTRDWRLTDRPTFNHPNRDALWDIEKSLQDLDKFEASASFDTILDAPIKELRNRLKAASDYLFRTDHSIAWVGDIGVGKTTALSMVTNIMVKDKDGKAKSVFPTGSGRTTSSEVMIKVAPAFGLAVEPMNEEVIRLLVTDLVTGIGTGDGGVSTEIDRVIRNMSDLKRQAGKGEDGQRTRTDPIAEMLKTSDAEQVVAYIIGRMTLAARTESQIILSEDAEGGLQWLSENITKINNGQHPSFSMAQKVTVLLPSKVLRETKYALTVIDTKGIEGTTQRPDLRAQFDDPRTLTVVCSKFNDAPGTACLNILREIQDSGADTAEKRRIVLLALPRDSEAMALQDDDGQTPETVEDGYLIREEHIQAALAKEGVAQIPALFFNAATDDAQATWRSLCGFINDIRQRQVERVERLVEATHELITNCDVAKTRQARRVVADTMRQVVKRHSNLLPMVRPAHQNLIDQIRRGHQSSIAAAVNRRGEWHNFPMHHMIGVGVRNDANLRSRDLFVRIDEQLTGLAEKHAHLNDVCQMLTSVKEDLDEWKQEFLGKALAVGKAIYKPHLDDAVDFWRSCAVRYGLGGGYRSDIADTITDFFEGQAMTDLRNKIDAGLNTEWQEVVLNRLLDATEFDESEP